MTLFVSLLFNASLVFANESGLELCQSEIQKWEELRQEYSLFLDRRIDFYQAYVDTYANHLRRLRSTSNPKRTLRQLLHDDLSDLLRARSKVREQLRITSRQWNRNTDVFSDIFSCYRNEDRKRGLMISVDDSVKLDQWQRQRAHYYSKSIEITRKLIATLMKNPSTLSDLYKRAMRKNTRKRVRKLLSVLADDVRSQRELADFERENKSQFVGSDYDDVVEIFQRIEQNLAKSN